MSNYDIISISSEGANPYKSQLDINNPEGSIPVFDTLANKLRRITIEDVNKNIPDSPVVKDKASVFTRLRDITLEIIESTKRYVEANAERIKLGDISKQDESLFKNGIMSSSPDPKNGKTSLQDNLEIYEKVITGFVEQTSPNVIKRIVKRINNARSLDLDSQSDSMRDAVVQLQDLVPNLPEGRKLEDLSIKTFKEWISLGINARKSNGNGLLVDSIRDYMDKAYHDLTPLQRLNLSQDIIDLCCSQIPGECVRITSPLFGAFVQDLYKNINVNLLFILKSAAFEAYSDVEF